MNSQALDYFLFDTDFFENDKIQLIEGEFGEKGGYIAVRLLCKIYGSKGYFYPWGEDECLLLCRKLSASFTPALLNQIVHGLVKRGLFDKDIFETHGCLTSVELQRRYFEGTRKRKEVLVKRELLLVDVSKYKNVSFFRENGDFFPENGGISEQSKVKESKEKKSILFPSLSSPSPDGEIKGGSEEEKEKIVYFFTFERNWAAPNNEYARLIAYNKGKAAWSKLPAEKREEYTKSWKSENSSSKYPSGFLECWRKVYEEFVNLDAPMEVRMDALADGLKGYKQDGYFHLYCTERLKLFMEESMDALKPILWPYIKSRDCAGLTYDIKQQ